MRRLRASAEWLMDEEFIHFLTGMAGSVVDHCSARAKIRAAACLYRTR